jgi:hypothetical protein
MASAPVNSLPLFYKDLVPLNSRDHANYKTTSTDKGEWMATQHAIPLTVDEFVQAQRFYPIVFSAGEESVPLALMGLNEGVNTFVDDEGKFLEATYVPAYARRYPFLLAKLTPEAEELSLCFDPTCRLIGPDVEGTALFDGDQPSEGCKNALNFCEQFEEAGFRTSNFMAELKKHDMLMEGEVSIQHEGFEQPFVYRGFQMINAEKLRDVRGDVLRTWNQNGLIALIFAHLFSLELISGVFTRQMQQGKVPVPVPGA